MEDITFPSEVEKLVIMSLRPCIMLGSSLLNQYTINSNPVYIEGSMLLLYISGSFEKTSRMLTNSFTEINPISTPMVA